MGSGQRGEGGAACSPGELCLLPPPDRRSDTGGVGAHPHFTFTA